MRFAMMAVLTMTLAAVAHAAQPKEAGITLGVCYTGGGTNIDQSLWSPTSDVPPEFE